MTPVWVPDAALEALERGLAIAERLAAADPRHAGWHRDLVVSRHKLAGLAQQRGAQSLLVAELRQCLAVLDRMKTRGTHLDPPMQQLHEWLTRTLSGTR